MCKFSATESQNPETQKAMITGIEKQEALLSDLSIQYRDLSKGYFGPESMTWQLYREPTIVLGSMRALLLQIAHPAIAHGVAKFSNFEKDFAGRAHRTFLSMVRIWFGDIPTANNSARRLYTIHSMIRGQKVWETEDETIVNPFCATDPDLLFWVLATLVDTTLILFEKTVRKLSQGEQEQFFEESKITAQLMGIPLVAYPENLEAFYIRYHQVITDGTLRLTEDGQAIKKALFKVPYPIRRINEILAEGFLPNPTKNIFGFTPAKWFLNSLLWGARLTNRITPDDLRYAPHYHQAMFRLALSNSRTPRIIERIHYWLSTHINWYFISNKLTVKRT
ncbi:MAG: hypothetical protein ACI8P3_000413 [Saprospiraceae bacterium]|jgi:uncharacterized protein (DUF2236 family)